ncbi:MAG: 5'/3'-nucleotidase SurE [Caldisericaceae bacterium]
MRILITNDDGIEAQGLKFLVREMVHIGEVFVVAPEGPQSAGSHSTTLHKPLRANHYPLNLGEKESFKVSGSPADCVVLALDVLIKEQIDIVISGINTGPNLGDDVIYSGTVAGAREGLLNGKPSFAVSVNSFVNPDFSYAAKFTAFFSNLVLEKALGKEFCININVPNIPREEVKGYKFTRLSKRRYTDRVMIGKDPFGSEFYWIGGKLLDEFEEGTDSRAVKEGYIAITPLVIDQTNYKFLDNIKELRFELP